MEDLLPIDNFNRLDQVGSIWVETEKGRNNPDFKGKQRRFGGNLTRSSKISKQIETLQIQWKTHQIWQDLTRFGEISPKIVEITLKFG